MSDTGLSVMQAAVRTFLDSLQKEKLIANYWWDETKKVWYVRKVTTVEFIPITFIITPEVT